MADVTTSRAENLSAMNRGRAALAYVLVSAPLLAIIAVVLAFYCLLAQSISASTVTPYTDILLPPIWVASPLLALLGLCVAPGRNFPSVATIAVLFFIAHMFLSANASATHWPQHAWMFALVTADVLFLVASGWIGFRRTNGFGLNIDPNWGRG